MPHNLPWLPPQQCFRPPVIPDDPLKPRRPSVTFLKTSDHSPAAEPVRKIFVVVD